MLNDIYRELISLCSGKIVYQPDYIQVGFDDLDNLLLLESGEYYIYLTPQGFKVLSRPMSAYGVLHVLPGCPFCHRAAKTLSQISDVVIQVKFKNEAPAPVFQIGDRQLIGAKTLKVFHEFIDSV